MNPCFWCSLWRCGEKKLLVANCLSIFGFDIYDTTNPPYNLTGKKKQVKQSLKLEKYTFEKRPHVFLSSKAYPKIQDMLPVQGNVSSGKWHPESKKMMLQKKKTKTLPSFFWEGMQGANYPNIITTPKNSKPLR